MAAAGGAGGPGLATGARGTAFARAGRLAQARAVPARRRVVVGQADRVVVATTGVSATTAAHRLETLLPRTTGAGHADVQGHVEGSKGGVIS